MLSPGQSLGDYRILCLLNSSRMAEVYLAEDTHHPIRRQVALKVIYPDRDNHTSWEAERLFKREVQAIVNLNHPNIVPLFDYSETTIHGQKLLYMVMPYHKDGSLADWLDKKSLRGQPLPPASVERLVRQAADALQCAHTHQIIHRDVKPSNFLVQDDAADLNDVHLQLADFGIARFMSRSTQTQPLLGTACYMAPERWRGQTVPATDQYALAVMAYELLTGRPPFPDAEEQLRDQHLTMQPAPPSAFNPNVSEELDKVLLRALAKEPANRYSSISAFADAFHEAIATADKIHAPVAPPVFPPTVPVHPMSPTSPLTNASSILPRQQAPRGSIVNPPRRGNLAPPSPRQRSIGKVLLGLLAVLLVALCITSLIRTPTLQKLLEAPGGTATAEIGLTASAGAKETSTALVVNATSTTIAQKRATANAQASATASTIAENPYPASFSSSGPMQGTLAFYDPMRDNSSVYEWAVNSAEVGSCSFQQGAYHAMMNAVSGPARFHPCIAQASPRFSNFAYEVHMKIITGECGGLLFRANDPKFYYFYICTNGRYGLVRYTADTPDTSVNPVLTHQYYSDLIKQGLNQENLLAVVANGPQIDLYVNQHKIDSVTDAVYSQGNIGVLARRETEQTDVVFNNARVWTFR